MKWLGFALLAFVLTACPAPGPSTPSVDESGGDGCDSPPATAGGEHGPPWSLDDGADETADPLLDAGPLPDPEDPTGWETATLSGQTVRYRSPTSAEMSAYGWTSEHLLVVPSTIFTNAVTGANSTALIVLPIHDISQSRPQEGLDLASVTLTRQWSHSRIPFYMKSIRGTSVSTSVSHPTLSFYLPAAISWNSIPERTIAVMASSKGTMEIHAGTRLERVVMRGPYSSTTGPFQLSLTPPSGGTKFYLMQTIHEEWTAPSMVGAPEPGAFQLLVAGNGELDFTAGPDAQLAVTGKCADELDNDPDGFADSCDYNCVLHEDYGGDVFTHTLTNEYSKDYALFGDLEFCTCVAPGDMAHTTMALFAVEGSSILNNVQPPPPYVPDIRSPPFRLVMDGCLGYAIGSYPEIGCDVATDCHSGGTCPRELDYPLPGYDNDYSAMLTVLWDAVDGMMDISVAANRFPVHMAGFVAAESGGSEAGLATVFNPNQPEVNGRFVVWSGSTNPGGPGAAIAHEIGHTLGLADEEGVDAVTWPNSPHRGFMNSYGSAPILNWDLDSAFGASSQGNIWELVPSKFHPRASGFGFTGCDPMDPLACDTGHPGLECNATSQVCQVAP